MHAVNEAEVQKTPAPVVADVKMIDVVMWWMSRLRADQGQGIRRL
jgi:hypothetical protein